ncbi:MAG: hypothetical protein M3R58_01010 [Pseudomonadota bacterium]|nr:hypothetical protein [Pseudomonadota bacterium]
MAAHIAGIPPRTRRDSFLRRDYWLITLAVSLFGATFLALFGSPFVPAFLALLLLMLCLYPAVRYGLEGGELVPAVPILAGAYAIQFALPVFFGDGTVWVVGGFKENEEGSLATALVIAIAAIGTFLWVSYSGIVAGLINRLPAIQLQLNRTRALAFCVLFGVFGLVASRSLGVLSPDTQIQYSAIFRVLQNQVLVSIGILAWLTYTSPSMALRIGYYALIAAAVIDGLSTGFLEAVLVPIGIMFACQWIYQHRINKGIVVFLVGAMLLLNPVKADFRSEAWQPGDEGGSRIDAAVLWVEKGLSYWGDVLRGNIGSDEAAVQLVRRTSMIDILAHVHETTPDSVPYLLGETYAYFAYSLIPRVLWPEKPTATANRTLAVHYGLTTVEGAERSTFGISLVGEGYANYGWVGAVSIMGFMAVVLLVLQRSFTTPQAGPGGYALFMAFFIFFPNGLGTSAEILFGNLLQSMIASYILMFWITQRRHVR